MSLDNRMEIGFFRSFKIFVKTLLGPVILLLLRVLIASIISSGSVDHISKLGKCISLEEYKTAGFVMVLLCIDDEILVLFDFFE